MKLAVASLANARLMAIRQQPAAVISLLGQHQKLPDFGTKPHLLLTFNDVVAASEGLRAPDDDDIRSMLEFVKSLPLESVLMIHCWMGVSRSTAAALILACGVCPKLDEHDAALTLRRLSPTATPNERMIELADRQLKRSGRLIDAVRGIGRGTNAEAVAPFIWELD
jgi:predicted protein tyrosine phosphatase